MIDQARELAVLLGGGLDSAALLSFYQHRGVSVRGVHIDYGQPSFAGERRAAENICAFYAVPLETLCLGSSLLCTNGEYAGRNALLALAASSTTSNPRSVALGIHSGTPYYDSSPAFLDDINRLFGGYFSGMTRVEAPFLSFIKRDIYAFAVQARVPIDLTFSCERQGDRPCGKCLSCQDREALLECP